MDIGNRDLGICVVGHLRMDVIFKPCRTEVEIQQSRLKSLQGREVVCQHSLGTHVFESSFASARPSLLERLLDVFGKGKVKFKVSAVIIDALFRTVRMLLFVCSAFALSGCASIFYSKTDTGKFSGKLYVEWIAPNQFIYRPDESEPLVFITVDGRKIQPKLMYTDGGSIPRLFWSVPNFGPWDFAPAYIIHDWLFEQHHCKNYDWLKYNFNDSAQILAEAMKTQMEKAGQAEPVLMYSVYEAVRSPIASRLWDSGTCNPPPVVTPQLVPGATPGPVVISPIRLLTIDIH